MTPQLLPVSSGSRGCLSPDREQAADLSPAPSLLLVSGKPEVGALSRSSPRTGLGQSSPSCLHLQPIGQRWPSLLAKHPGVIPQHGPSLQRTLTEAGETEKLHKCKHSKRNTKLLHKIDDALQIFMFFEQQMPFLVECLGSNQTFKTNGMQCSLPNVKLKNLTFVEASELVWVALLENQCLWSQFGHRIRFVPLISPNCCCNNMQTPQTLSE